MPRSLFARCSSGSNRAQWLSLLLVLPLAALPARAAAEPLPRLAQAVPSAQARLTEQADERLQQGASQFQRRQWDTAEHLWQEALRLYRQAGNRVGEGRVLGNLAAIQEAIGRPQAALRLFQQSLAVAEAMGDRRGVSFALSNLGFLYTRLGQYDEAIARLQAALPLTQQMGDREGEYDVLNQLGIVHRAQGRYDEAIAAFQQSLAIAQAENSRRGQANVLGNLGNTYTEQGNYPAALESYQKTLELAQQGQDRVMQAGVLQRLGQLYTRLGNLSRAVAVLEEGLALARGVGDRRLQAYTLGSLGTVYARTTEPDRAVPLLQSAIEITAQLEDRPNEGALRQVLGSAYAAMGNLRAARQQYEQALAIARSIGDRAGEGQALGELGQLLTDEGKPAEAVAHYQRALAILREIGDRPNQGRALSLLGEALVDQGNLEAAADALTEAVDIWESLRPGLSDADQVSLFETQASTYRLLQQVLIDLGKTQEALLIAERGRSRAFLELVAQRLSAQAALRLQTPPPSLSEIRQIARQQEATLVQYTLLNRNRLGIWVIRPDGDIQFRQTTLPETTLSIEDTAEQTRVAAALGRGATATEVQVASLVSQTRSDLRDSRALPNTPAPAAPTRRISRKLQTLHQLLIEPIADLLPRDPTAQVVFIPQGQLYLVPFATLQGADGSFLIERHTIRTAPAIQILGLTHARQGQRRGPASSLIVGNPTMPSVGEPPQPLGSLPYAEQEAQAIAQILDTQAITGSQASETAIAQRMANARIIHLATHGLLDDVAGLGVPGALALAPTAESDGLLTTNEILGLSLPNADLVVLSACDTGRGKITGDGVIGLSRSFISAGASSVVVSLWAVPDDSTAALMTAFYQSLKQNPNRAQALRQAMLTVMQQYPSSRDWGAFVLMGEAE
ncbi:CHAT domain-containing tetratricopeptide repeat protein [Leptolyngbya sp. O-77]|uniref:CHAT domain-containing tetratricopeptide repeat protein n=1 Tax=Leptolyngbya sp. O-77 TaxID=1080068 RepID=UPI00074D402C|nr:CHAT domain-containing tetratricopeptide repeat protein [Leptolyngbya sp. O-77]BAU44175.1 Regulatory protein AfsR [Leptolyngbya sp. O-77]